MAASTSFVYSASQCSGVADYLGECTGSQLTTLALYRQSESSTYVYCGLLNTKGNVLVVATMVAGSLPLGQSVCILYIPYMQDLLNAHVGECT